MSTSHLEEEFAALWVIYYPDIDLYSEHIFHPERKFRLDFAHVPTKVGIEIQGGIWTNGKAAHSTGSGVQRDFEKQCLAASEGWLIFPLSEKMLRDEEWLKLIANCIEARQEHNADQNLGSGSMRPVRKGDKPIQSRYQSFGLWE